MSKKLRGDLMLLSAALIWGTAFVAQRAGMDYIGPFTFNGIRSFIGCLVLIPVILVMDKQRKRQNPYNEMQPNSKTQQKINRKTLLTGGILCGLVLFASSTLQQFGMVYTTAGKAGFITALYIVIVPILGLFIGKKVRTIIWLCVSLATGGLYLLCMKKSLELGIGDLLVLACALGFSIHILVIDHFSHQTDGVRMSCIQFFICGILSFPCAMIFETFNWNNIVACWLPILYAGALSSGIAYTLQIVAQKNTEPAIASLILSLESVFAVIAGILILNEQISIREALGCSIMFAAIILAQLPAPNRPRLDT